MYRLLQAGTSPGLRSDPVFGKPVPGQTVWQDGKKHRVPKPLEVWVERFIRLADPVEYTNIGLEHGAGYDRGFDGLLNPAKTGDKVDTGLEQNRLSMLQQKADKAGDDYAVITGSVIREEDPGLLMRL